MSASSALTGALKHAWATVHRLGAFDTDSAIEAYTEIDIPQSLRDNLALFLRLERRVLQEYDPAICETFDQLLNSVIHANEGNPGSDAAGEPTDAEGVPTGVLSVPCRNIHSGASVAAFSDIEAQYRLADSYLRRQ